MSRIAELIAEMCPGGVEFKALGDVGQLIRGRRFTKDDVVPDGLGSIHYGEIYTRYGTSARTTFSRVRADLAPQLRFARSGDVVIAAVGETVEDVGKAVAWLGDEEVAVHDDCFIFRGSLDPEFVSYCFQTSMLNAQKTKYVARAKVKRLSGENLSKLRIPVPPLRIQREIVRILDTFAELKGELDVQLEAEREARQHQYEFYRDRLLTFTERERVRWVTLGDVARFTYGFTAKAADAGDYRFIRITDITEAGNLAPSGAKYVKSSPEAREYLVKSGDLLVARTGATFGKTVLIDQAEPSVYASFLIRIELDRTVVVPGYYWHFAQSSEYWRQAERMVGRGGQPQFNANVLKRVEFPIPPLDDQRRIAGLLDGFGSLVSDLSISLPAELNARGKQYGYYRDRLLTFEEAAA